MSESKDRSDASKAKTFDEAWDSLPDPPSGSGGGTKAWTEDVRGARKRDGDAPEVEEPAPERTDETRAWTDEVRGARKHDAAAAAPEQDEMDRLMREEPAGDAPPQEEIEPSASTSTMSFDALELPERAKPDESLMDALMGAEASKSDGAQRAVATQAEGDEAPEEEEEEEEEDAPEEEDFDREDEPSSRDADGADVSDEEAASPEPGGSTDHEEDADEEEDELPPPIVLHPGRTESESTPHPKPAVEPARPRKKSGKKRLPLIVGGTVAAGLALWFGREPDPKPPADNGPDEVTAELDAKALGPATPNIVAAPPEAEPDVGTAPPDVTPERAPPPVSDPNRDPREPPEGTPPEVAAVFKKLPVSPADRAPVGAVGKTGIHVDDVSMGSVYERSRCSGGQGSFSVGQGDRVNVCLRVVHQRQKEELSVVWQKIGGNARRGKIVVKPMHAYRTRAYLKLRGEYVGDWEVKVFSEDGAELARYPFTVVP